MKPLQADDVIASFPPSHVVKVWSCLSRPPIIKGPDLVLLVFHIPPSFIFSTVSPGMLKDNAAAASWRFSSTRRLPNDFLFRLSRSSSVCDRVITARLSVDQSFRAESVCRCVCVCVSESHFRLIQVM